MGDKIMKNNRQMLTSILKTAQMGQVGIQSVLRSSMRPAMRKNLEDLLHEFSSIESEAHGIAHQRGWQLKELDPAMKFMADKMTRMKLMRYNSDSRIADMIIQGNTQGMIKGLRDIHQFGTLDGQISTLSQKLLDCETANIQQMQEYL